MNTRKSESRIKPKEVEYLQGSVLVRRNVEQVDSEDSIIFQYDEDVYDVNEYENLKQWQL